MNIGFQNSCSDLRSIDCRALLFLLTACFSASALAQPSKTATTLHHYQIPAQPLADALIQFGQQSGMEVTANSALLTGKQSPGVNGNLSFQEAMSLLLKDSHLVYHIRGNMLVLLPAAQGSVIPLPAIRVRDGLPVRGNGENRYRLNDIASAGPWTERAAQDTPHAISAANATQISNVIAGDMDQIYKMNPVVQNSAPNTVYGTPYAAIRGFHTQHSIINGVRLSSMPVGISMEELERVEIINGLTGFLYGGDNPGGATHYVTKRPSYQPLADLTLGNYGDQQYFTHLDLGNVLDETQQFAYRFNAARTDGETSKHDQHIERNLLSAALDWHIGDALLQFETGYQNFRTDRVDSRFYTSGLSDWPKAFNNRLTYTPGWTYNDTETARASTNLIWEIDPSQTLRAAYLYKRDIRSSQYSYPYLSHTGWRMSINQSAPSRHLSQGGHLYLDHRFETGNIKHVLTTGMAFEHYITRQNSNGFASTDTPNGLTPQELMNYPDPGLVTGNGFDYTSHDASAMNIVLTDDIQLNHQWSVMAGLNYSTLESLSRARITYNESRYSRSRLIPSLTLLYKPLSALTTYISYVEGMENGIRVPDNFANGGQILAPNSSKQYELGIKSSLTNSLALNTALFRVEKANHYLENDRYVQEGKRIHQGLEISLNGQISNLTLIAGGVIMDMGVEGQNGDTPEFKTFTGVASTLAKFYLEYDVPQLTGLTLTGGVYYTGPKFKDITETRKIDGYTLTDIGLRYQTTLGNKSSAFNLNLTNLENTDYWASDYSLGIPRTLSFSLKIGL